MSLLIEKKRLILHHIFLLFLFRFFLNWSELSISLTNRSRCLFWAIETMIVYYRRHKKWIHDCCSPDSCSRDSCSPDTCSPRTVAPRTVAPATLAPQRHLLPKTVAPRTVALRDTCSPATLAPQWHLLPRQLLPRHLLSDDTCSPRTFAPRTVLSTTLPLEILFFLRLLFRSEEQVKNQLRKMLKINKDHPMSSHLDSLHLKHKVTHPHLDHRIKLAGKH